jgi:predicted ATP-grasp superfamily ATP-dependent carboligase
LSEILSRSWDAVVLGLEINGLGVVRSLGSMNLKVLGIYTSSSEIGRFSKYCFAFKVQSGKLSTAESEIADLLELVGKQQKEKPVLFMTSDYYVKLVNERRSRLSIYYHIPLPDKWLVETILSKDKQYELMTSLDVSVPATYRFKNVDDIEKSGISSFPIIMKPLNSCSFSLPDDSKNIIFHSIAEMVNIASKYPDLLQNAIFQEIIQGGDSAIYYCTMYFDSYSSVKAIFCARKIRQYKPDFGITCFAESITEDEVIETALYVMDKIKYKGIVDIEFIKDNNTGEYKFIEMNPRTHWANSHSTACGVNLPFIAYLDFRHNSNKNQIPRQLDGIKWIYLKSDIGSYRRKRRRGELTLLQWLSTVISARAFACFHIKDLLPCIADSMLLIKSIIGKEPS